MTEGNNGKKSWIEMFRWITPVLITISIFYLGQVNSNLTEIRTDLFHHLTNADIHTLRTDVVDRNEWAIYQTMREKQMIDLNYQLTENGKRLERIEVLMINHMSKDK